MWMRTATGSATTAVIMQAETARAEIMWTRITTESATITEQAETVRDITQARETDITEVPADNRLGIGYAL